MNPEEFYDSLRPEDQKRVRLTVDELKAKGFQVFATGSSLERADYNDVDLVAKPQEGMTEGDTRACLDTVVESLKAQGASEETDYLDVSTRLFPAPHKLYGQSSVKVRGGFGFLDAGDGEGYSVHRDLHSTKADSKSTEIQDTNKCVKFYGLFNFGEEFPIALLPKDIDTYIKSEITHRRNVQYGKTKIDISVSYEPFGLDPNTKHVEL